MTDRAQERVPRPDDPLSSARTEAISLMGGNGCMAVSATHAALLLAQGAGRLIRRSDGRGVVAFPDYRMMTARCAGFPQRSLPPFWPAPDRDLVLGALRRLDETASAPQRSSRGNGPVPDRRRWLARPGPRSRGHAWTDEQDEDLHEAVEAGVGNEEVAEHLELAPELVTARRPDQPAAVGGCCPVAVA